MLYCESYFRIILQPMQSSQWLRRSAEGAERYSTAMEVQEFMMLLIDYLYATSHECQSKFEGQDSMLK